ncbi:MAG TPA: hypothetical protein VIQ24_20385 [Pyrinomonadaceae bacterium]
MAEVKRGGEARGDRQGITAADDDATVVAPRFDEREAATARPVVPLGSSNSTAPVERGNFSWRVNSHHLLLAWAVVATLAAGTFAIYRNTQTSEAQQVTLQPAPPSTAGETASPTPKPLRREIPVPPVRAAKMSEARDARPSWEDRDWSDSEEITRDEKDEEELDEHARKEEKRRRKEEKKRREEFEKETERALKESRKQAERLRERQKDEGGKSRLIGVITRGAGM